MQPFEIKGLDEYQNLAATFSLGTRPTPGGTVEDIVYPVFGAMEELGELAGIFKRIDRDGIGIATPDDMDMIKKELGDVLWYLADICTRLGLKLSDVAATNGNKLTDRKMRNKIHGRGDNR